MITEAFERLEPAVGIKPACELTGRSRATVYRRRNPKPRVAGPRRAPSPHPASLSELEQARVLGVLRSQRFVDKSPAQIWATRAMKELQAAGYVVCTNIQNERGHWSKHVTVYDVPQTEAPKDETPKPCRTKSRFTGLEPLRGKNQGKNPPAPEVSDVTAEAATEEGGIAPKSNDEKTGQAAGVLSRLGSAAPAMTLKRPRSSSSPLWLLSGWPVVQLSFRSATS
ncbi:hypothetical protein [Actinacidiphila oryziradicis]|uniref:Uncharacterized protein n=1 Tax=Actinacidiphila oryziradicis TaxID=2571141 RepID=A0A4U0R713_9ACTN|nr:hypothetical protein [Actinacidiphila oryziradicis]TJZ90833.1 hypothetical protein FCI23_55665 [Actinacidiphila oryziradicis]